MISLRQRLKVMWAATHKRLFLLLPFLLGLVGFLLLQAQGGPNNSSQAKRGGVAAQIREQCLTSGGQFIIPVTKGVSMEKQKFVLDGAYWFDFRHLFTKVVIHPSDNNQPNIGILIIEGLINKTHLESLSVDSSLVESVWSFFTGATEEKYRQGIASPFGEQTLVVFHPNTDPVEIECTREVDWVVVGMVTSGFFLSTMSGILGAYHATLLICGAILGMLLGIAIPVLFLFNKQTKVFVTAASAGLVSYGAVFCWHWMVGSTYFWMYLCLSAMFGMWWFGTGNIQGGKQVVSWSLLLLGMVLLGTSTVHFGTINTVLLGLAIICRVVVELKIPHRFLDHIGKNFYWHIWLKIFPNYKRMLANEEYEAQSQQATKEAMDQLRLYYFKFDDWRSLYQDNPEAIKRIETFLGNKDHIQLNLDAVKKGN